MMIVHFKLPSLGREVPDELNELRKRITGYNKCEFYTVPAGVYDVPMQVKEVKICDPVEFMKLGGKIFVANAELADKVTKVYDDLKFWLYELESDSKVFTKEEILKNIEKYEKEFQEALIEYGSTLREIKKDEIDRVLSEFTVQSVEDYGSCSIDIYVTPYLPEFLLCVEDGSRAEKYLQSLPYVSRFDVYDLVKISKHIQI